MTAKIELAKKLAKQIHKDQIRESGLDYFTHLENTAGLLQQIEAQSEDLFIATYLHHALDKDKYLEKKIYDQFGEKPVLIIKDYYQLSNSEMTNVDPSQVKTSLILKTYTELINLPETILIRLADKTDNIKSAHVLNRDRAEKIAMRALYLYSPLAKLLGLYPFVRILEDNAFKIIDPANYYWIINYVERELPNTSEIIKETSMFLKEILLENNINALIEYRKKHTYSIYKKTLRNDGNIFLFDIAALRILVKTVEECYETEDILKKLWDNIPEERDDYISNPKTSGYKGIHNTFLLDKKYPFEIQIKTNKMHEYNEYGQASHFLYKIGKSLRQKIEENSNWLREINYLENKEHIKVNHFSDKVYAFTPKGDIIELQKGSTPIDFAYKIHDNIGNSCVGSIVNGQIEPLNYELKTGDRVFIKTDKSKKKPSMDWLDFVATSNARCKIRQGLRKAGEVV